MTDPQQPRWIEYMPLDEVPAAPRNAKAHDDKAIAASISRFGFADGPILDERTGRLVAGHGRLDDLRWRRDQGKAAPDGVLVDEDGTWRVGVQRGWASRSDEDAEGFLIGHNRSGERGGWDDRILAETLQDLAQFDPGLLEAAGYVDRDVDRLIASFAADDNDPSWGDGDDDEDDEDDEEGGGEPDPDHTQWHTVVIRDVTPTVRASWLAHLSTFNDDENAALANLLDADPDQ